MLGTIFYLLAKISDFKTEKKQKLRKIPRKAEMEQITPYYIYMREWIAE